MTKKQLYLKMIRLRLLRFIGIPQLGVSLLRKHNKFFIVDLVQTRDAVINLCPRCISETSKDIMYEDTVFSCNGCLYWGPWSERVRLSPNKRRKDYWSQFRKVGIHFSKE